MKANIAWLDDPQIYKVGTMPAHSDHHWYANQEEIATGSSLEQSLDGTWQFHFSEQPKQRPVDFFETTFDEAGFSTIQVPGHIELAGYGQIHYINTMYPWDGVQYRRPAYTLSDEVKADFSTGEDNTVGSYVKRFELNPALQNKEVIVRFEGVEEAMYVWLNGQFVGYAEDSFTPTEFDLTPYLVAGENRLAVEVYKRSTAAFIEDQDFFRFSGIFRSVTLLAKLSLHLEDLTIRPTVSDDFQTGQLTVKLKNLLAEAGEVAVTVFNPEGAVIAKEQLAAASDMTLAFPPITNVSLWSHGQPQLYKLEVIFRNAQGIVEVVPYDFGFRKIEIKNKIMYLNGQRLILNGVNRHEWSAQTGRSIGQEEMDYDIALLQKHHINSVRTSHYPNQLKWYQMCDEAGISMMAEVNLESHGSWQKMGAFEPSYNVPRSVPQWEAAVLDRARTLFETVKNHVSILFWSLGNESYVGDTLEKMNAYFKESDETRLTHYEGVYVERERYEDSVSDVESRMYASPEQIREYLENAPKKPFILCEFMHDMGNSLGGLGDYMKLLDEYPMYQGGYIWDYIDQALEVTDEVTGQQVLRYGGDFDDRPSDYEFSGNGIVFANRIEKPALQEVGFYYGKYSK